MTQPILIVEDNPFHRMGVEFHLTSCGYHVLTAADVETGWQTAVAHPIQTAIVDVVLPPAPNQPENDTQSLGIELVRRLKTHNPALGIVVYSAFRDRGAGLISLMHEGYMGMAYKIKGAGTSPESLLRALTAVANHDIYFDPQIVELEIGLQHTFTQSLDPLERAWVMNIKQHYDELTSTEEEIIHLVGASYSIKGIAEKLNIAEKSASNYVNRVYRKLGLQDTPKQLRKNVLLAKGYTLYQLERSFAHKL